MLQLINTTLLSREWQLVSLSSRGGKVGIGSSTPWGLFSVNPDGITGPAFVVGSSTRTNFIVTQSGNVGIGSVNAARKLTIDYTDNNAAANNQSFFINQRGTGDPRIGFEISSVTGWELGVDNSDSDKFKIANSTGSGDFTATGITIDTSGNLGVGQTSPDQGKVEVKGGSVCVDTNSDDSATSCIANESDERLKTNIETLSASSSLGTILALNPVSFDWRVDDPEVLSHYPLISRFASSTRSVGLIAQQVQSLLPEAIMEETVGDEEVQYLQLDYLKIIPHLIGAIQEIANLGNSIKQKLMTWFADAQNGIKNFFAKKIHTEELCIAKSNGEEVCVDGDQLSALLAGAEVPNNDTSEEEEEPSEPVVEEEENEETPPEEEEVVVEEVEAVEEPQEEEVVDDPQVVEEEPQQEPEQESEEPQESPQESETI